MKLASYYRQRGDDVRFFKGDLKRFAAKLLCEEYLAEVGDSRLGKYFPQLVDFIKIGQFSYIDAIPSFRKSHLETALLDYRRRFRVGDFPKFDVIGVTTLFTFYWRETIDTINYSKRFLRDGGQLLVGGISATILHSQMAKETEIEPFVGQLDWPGVLDSDSDVIIDELPLDYSILEEIDYRYPAGNAYFAYMTRGCPRKCSFCAVPRLEPKYKDYICLEPQIRQASERFGSKKDLLLMDNNVFASRKFEAITNEIKSCGFQHGAVFVPDSEYDVALRNLRDGYNHRGYIKKIVGLYDRISERLTDESDLASFYLRREELNLLYPEVATAEAIDSFDSVARPLYDRYFKRVKRMRIVDFNQGVDARLVTDEKMAKLAETNIRPLRIAFDHFGMRDEYERAIRVAARHGIKDLSNYLLYNFEDHPDELYLRMRLNVDLCEELGVTIYSFPMKYHPIDDPEYFQNRDFVGKHWNRKFVRAVQAVLNSTKGKIGRGKSFFDEAFGENLDGYHKILWMPEAFIIHRFKYKENLTAEWWENFQSLTMVQRIKVEEVVANNVFDARAMATGDLAVDGVLKYYAIRRTRPHSSP